MKPVIIGGLASMVAAAIIGCGAPQAPTVLPATPTPTAQVIQLEDLLSRVRSGNYDAYSYVREVAGRTPEVQKLASAGAIASILYGLSPQEFAAVHRQLLAGRVHEEILNSGLAELERPSPSLIEQFSRNPTATSAFLYELRLPMFIHIPKLLIESPDYAFIESEDDLRAVLKHEAQHVTDTFYGIQYGDGTRITREDYGLGKVSPGFMGSLYEVRAHYWQIYDAVAANLGVTQAKYSIRLVKNCLASYQAHWNNIAAMKLNETEKRIWDLQRKDMPGITPFLDNGVPAVRFELEGIKATISVGNR